MLHVKIFREWSLARGIKAREPEDELRLVKDWVGGKSISEIRSTYWIAQQQNQFGEYIADRVIYKLPWGFNGFLRIFTFKLEKKYDELPLAWQYLPSMMKFGVNSVFACWISGLGFSSVQLALVLARHYQLTNRTFISFIKWIINLDAEFIFQEVPQGSIAEKEEVMQKIHRDDDG